MYLHQAGARKHSHWEVLIKSVGTFRFWYNRKQCRHYTNIYVIVLFLYMMNIYKWDSVLSQVWTDVKEDNNNKLQLGCYPVAVVILHVYNTWNWLLINLSREGYMRSM